MLQFTRANEKHCSVLPGLDWSSNGHACRGPQSKGTYSPHGITYPHALALQISSCFQEGSHIKSQEWKRLRGKDQKLESPIYPSVYHSSSPRPWNFSYLNLTSITHMVLPLRDMVSKMANTRIRFTGNYLNLFPGPLSSCLISTLLCLFAFIHLFTYSAFIERLHNHSKYSAYAQIAHSGGDSG